jgi:hypothetical protein
MGDHGDAVLLASWMANWLRCKFDCQVGGTVIMLYSAVTTFSWFLTVCLLASSCRGCGFYICHFMSPPCLGKGWRSTVNMDWRCVIVFLRGCLYLGGWAVAQTEKWYPACRMRANGNRMRANGNRMRANGNRMRANGNRLRVNGNMMRVNGSGVPSTI